MTSTELEAKKAEINLLLAEYEAAILTADIWYREWKARNSGFRAARRKETNDFQ